MFVGTLGDAGSVASLNQFLGEVGGETSHNYTLKMARDDAVLQLSVKPCIGLHPSRQQLVYFSCVCPIIQQQATTCGVQGPGGGGLKSGQTPHVCWAGKTPNVVVCSYLGAADSKLFSTQFIHPNR